MHALALPEPPRSPTPSSLLAGKRVLVTGVLSDRSIAYAVAELAQRAGAEIVLTSFGRGMSLTRRVARRLGEPPDVLELDVTSHADLVRVRDDLGARWGRVDGVLHSVAFAPAACLGDDFMVAEWPDVSTALEVSAYSLKALAHTLRPLFVRGSAIVGLDFDARQAWPQYNWMGVAKAALESTARYLARELGPAGVRVNLVAAGPTRTVAAGAIPGFEHIESVWASRAPLGWTGDGADSIARACVALLSDWFPATTGEIVHVDGGFHAVAL